MKKIFALLLALLLMLSVASAESIDLSSLSFDELATLVNRAQMEMMKSDIWQQVEVPAGTYQVGKDIPAGKWNIAVNDAGYVDFEIGTVIKANAEIDPFSCIDEYKHITLIGPQSFMYTEGSPTSYTIDLNDGWYIVITSGSVFFTPYAGNSFSFK